MSTNNDSVTPLVSLESLQLNCWENFIDNGEINDEDFNIITKGAGYSNSNTIIITSSTGEGALVYMKCDGVNGNVLSVNVQSSGIGYTDNFTISYPDTGNTPNVTSNATITLNSEFDSSGGPCLARYITKPIILTDGFDAGDIRVFLSANKPVGTELHVFYKILSGSDTTNFSDRPYGKFECLNPSERKLLKVEGGQFVKDSKNGAILAVNRNILEQNEARKKLGKKLSGNDDEINNLKTKIEEMFNDMNEIKSLLQTLIHKKD